jgi:hypothetical protein
MVSRAHATALLQQDSTKPLRSVFVLVTDSGHRAGNPSQVADKIKLRQLGTAADGAIPGPVAHAIDWP